MCLLYAFQVQNNIRDKGILLQSLSEIRIRAFSLQVNVDAPCCPDRSAAAPR